MNYLIIMFKKIGRMKAKHQVLFAIIIAFAVISFWRGLWGMWDIYVLPENYEVSLWISLAAGLVILLATNYAVKEFT